MTLNSIWSQLENVLWVPMFIIPMDSLAVISDQFDPDNERKWQICQQELRRRYYFD